MEKRGNWGPIVVAVVLLAIAVICLLWQRSALNDALSSEEALKQRLIAKQALAGTAEAERAELEQQKADAEAALAELTQQKADAEAALAELEQQKADADAKLTELTQQKADADAEIAGLRAQLAAQPVAEAQSEDATADDVPALPPATATEAPTDDGTSVEGDEADGTKTDAASEAQSEDATATGAPTDDAASVEGDETDGTKTDAASEAAEQIAALEQQLAEREQQLDALTAQQATDAEELERLRAQQATDAAELRQLREQKGADSAELQRMQAADAAEIARLTAQQQADAAEIERLTAQQTADAAEIAARLGADRSGAVLDAEAAPAIPVADGAALLHVDSTAQPGQTLTVRLLVDGRILGEAALDGPDAALDALPLDEVPETDGEATLEYELSADGNVLSRLRVPVRLTVE